MTFEFETEERARAVLADIFQILNTYGYISVADVYDLVGQPSSYTDNKRGWFDIHIFTVIENSGVWVIECADPIPLE
jgi:hypothetical protein